ncbi:MAG: RNA polymerase sigma factor [Gammaproteobacteria bacterium]|nr:MAG: RNA polymerase sigma factor [Gammaproteobacteria bacterium]
MDQTYSEQLCGAETISTITDCSSNDHVLPPLTMEAFLADIEKKAYHMAKFATGSHADALDLLQDSMIKLVTKYQHRPSNEWKPLFYKILQNRIKDWYRHQKVKNLLFFWKANNNDIDDNNDQQDHSSSTTNEDNLPENSLTKSQQQNDAIEALQQLSSKQQQCFLLRSWEGLSVAETANIMGCSQGSVKTHYFRATTKLKLLLETEHDIII